MILPNFEGHLVWSISLHAAFRQNRLRMLLLLALLAFSSTNANAQYNRAQCTNLIKETTGALRQRAYKQVISLARHQLTYCRDVMEKGEVITAFGFLALGLNGDGQHEEALAVANRCLQIDSVELGCAYEKAAALVDLRRPQEARATLQRALTQPAITEADIKYKRALRTLLSAVDREIQNLPPTPNGRDGYGSGFFVSNVGHIITNWHVANDCKDMQTANGAALKLIHFDKALDVALLQAVGVKPLAVASFRTTETVLGEDIIVFGFPLPGILSSSGNLTTGTVSAISGLLDNRRNLQISAPIQPGNSGGPLLDQFGNVIGVVVAKLDAAKAASIIGDIPQNVNFAIKGQIRCRR
jgi:S1-C subfamily serine protease